MYKVVGFALLVLYYFLNEIIWIFKNGEGVLGSSSLQS